ncbi:response regulator transcription factor [Brevibacterium samyangense]|uniref:HTH luxR-type domain-containing protein n=1 Tax=Brevibacterium samyangense TaxID=366888 RepID=A0ABP5EHB5_9MICO
MPLPGSPRLTDRQRATLEAIGRGWDIAETAERLGVARSTVESHLKELRVKLGATSLSTLIVQGYRHGFIEIPR